MHPREQNGACSWLGGFRQIGQRLESDGFGIGAGDGQRGVRAQGDASADLPRERVDPMESALEDCNDGRMSSKGDGTRAFERRNSKQRPGFERGPVGGKLEQARA